MQIKPHLADALVSLVKAIGCEGEISVAAHWYGQAGRANNLQIGIFIRFINEEILNHRAEELQAKLKRLYQHHPDCRDWATFPAMMQQAMNETQYELNEEFINKL